MTTQPAQTVDLIIGPLNQVAEAHIGVMIVDAPRIRLGLVEPDGREHIDWYAEGQTLTASGLEWQLTHVRNPSASGTRQHVATLAPTQAAGGKDEKHVPLTAGATPMFVEVETDADDSVSVGEWIHRPHASGVHSGERSDAGA